MMLRVLRSAGRAVNMPKGYHTEGEGTAEKQRKTNLKGVAARQSRVDTFPEQWREENKLGSAS
jgi:hypothetical protein